MARILVESEGMAELIAGFNGVRPRAVRNWARTAYSEGAKTVTEIVRNQPKRTGTLGRSYGHDVKQTNSKVRLEVGTIKPGADKKVLAYAAAQEFGATIRPKKAKALTIPLDGAKTAAGVARGDARSFPNTFIAKGLILQRQPDGSLLPLFKLAKEVTIEGTGIASAAVLAAHKRLEKRVADDFESALLEP